MVSAKSSSTQILPLATGKPYQAFFCQLFIAGHINGYTAGLAGNCSLKTHLIYPMPQLN
jgi:hypothetical protein